MKHRQWIYGITIFLLVIGNVIAFQNCSVRRLDMASGGQGTVLGSVTGGSGVTGATGADSGVATGGTTSGTTATTTDGSGGGATTTTTAASSGGNCTAGPLNPQFGLFTPSTTLRSQDATVSRISSTYLKSTTITLFASNSCIQSGHSCTTTTTSTTTTTTCQAAPMSGLSISFKCSDTATAQTCDLISANEDVDLTNKSSTAVHNINISFMDSTNYCDSTKMKTFMSMDMSTYKLIGGHVIFRQIEGTTPGKNISVELQNVVLKTQSGADSIQVSGTYSAAITCDSTTTM